MFGSALGRARAYRRRRRRARAWASLPESWVFGPPDFVGIGAPRSGTSRWFWLLQERPGVVASPAGKETHYFDRFWRREDDGDYGSLFPRPSGAVIGEWTPSYLDSFHTPRMLRESAPDARLLVILRDPLERLYSALATTGPPWDFSNVHHQIWRGLYAQHLTRWLSEFDRDRILILQYECCVADPQEQFDRTCAFLGLEPFVPKALHAVRNPAAGPKPTVSDALVDGVRAAYGADAARLAALCPDLDFDLWSMTG